MKYLQRVADKMLQERLETFGAVLIEGPKWTGKTTTAEQHAKSFIKLQDPDMADEYLATAATRMHLLYGMRCAQPLTKLMEFQGSIS